VSRPACLLPSSSIVHSTDANKTLPYNPLPS
jgi:hypothetical protein